MNTLLMILAVVLMIANLGLFAARLWRGECLDLALMPPRLKAFCQTTITAGMLLASTGVWIEPLLWIGLIILDCGSIAYFLYTEETPGER